MKRIYLFFVLILLSSCEKKNEVKTGKLNPSFGSRNHITVVIDDELWNGEVGDSIRNKLAQTYFGLEKDEPIFDIDQYSPTIFNAKAKTARNIVHFSNSDEYSFILEKSFLATPQNYFFIRAKNSKELIHNFNTHADSIISVFRNSELNEEQHQLVRKPLLETKEVKEIFACTVKIPNTFHLIDVDDGFLWFQKDLASGNSNIVIYEVPISDVENLKDEVSSNLIKIQDSISKFYIQGTNANSYFKTEDSFFPSFKPFQIQQLHGYEIRGNWEMNNDFMSGPFITFALKDEYYNRYIFFQAFVNNPYKAKRDLLFEMEAIIKTVNFYDNEN